MSLPLLPLQAAVVAALKAGVSGVAGRVFDRVPADAPYPLIELGEFQALDDGVGCIAGHEVFITLHVWSRAVGKVEAGALASEVETALHEADLDLLPDWHLVEIAHQGTRLLLDPDGLTTHAVATFRALTVAA